MWSFWIISLGSARPWAQQSFGSHDQFFTLGEALTRSIDQIDFNFIEASNSQEPGSNSFGGSHLRHVKTAVPVEKSLAYGVHDYSLLPYEKLREVKWFQF
jgi:hypothetical protein